MKQSFGLAGLALALALVACSGTQGFGPERVRGTISYYDEPVQITVPDSVRRGETFAVTVMTFVGGCFELERPRSAPMT